ncbi:MAG: T9SS type A sorting domain-containing protein, partial [Ignavibacteriales bacterium]|nr:T9SS type A sorting domain-containing protein [Ignavibacteriales bacterium]
VNPFTFGYTPEQYEPMFDFGGNHKAVLAMWFIAPGNGMIDTLFWLKGNYYPQSEPDLVTVRIHKSNVTPAHGPGADFPSNCITWGYFSNSNDLDQGISPFIEDATDTTWFSTIEQPYHTFPPMGDEIWGFGGYPVYEQHNSVNVLDLSSLGFTPQIEARQVFWISLTLVGQHPIDPTHYWFSGFPSFDQTHGAPVPSRAWKFYEHGRSYNPHSNFFCHSAAVDTLIGKLCEFCPIETTYSTPRGWYARGGLPEENPNGALAFNWWYTMTITSDIPPAVVSFDKLKHTSSSLSRLVTAEIQDCDPVDLTRAGVQSSMIVYSPLITYKVVHQQNLFYTLDTTTFAQWVEINSPGNRISNWFTRNEVPPIDSFDVCTAGPFELGGSLFYFGEHVRYAWVSPDGVVALSNAVTDTIEIYRVFSHCFPTLNIPCAELPRNLIAPYCHDLAAYPPNLNGAGNGNIYSKQEGTKFIVEWDHIANALNAGDSTITFELILDHTDNSIEFLYKDIGIGGLDLEPLVGLQAEPTEKWFFVNENGGPPEWKPTNNRGLRFTTNFPASVQDGWNLVSSPVSMSDPRKLIVFPSAASAAFAYENGYVPQDTIKNGTGYWLKYSGSQTVPINGLLRSLDTVNVVQGWNMIGSIGTPVLASSIIQIPAGIKQSNYFGYDVTGYFIADSITPGEGYWIKTNAAGKLVLSSTGGSVKEGLAINPLEKFNALIFRDAEGNSQSLYFASEQHLTTPIEGFELPPSPPDQTFDVRFTSNSLVTIYPEYIERAKEFSITLTGVSYPLRVNYIPNQRENKSFSLVEQKERVAVKTHALQGDKVTVINRHELDFLLLRVCQGAALPTKYALYQNYPNPFNPITKIEYDLPNISHVNLKVYNLLGQEVETLVDEIQEAGYKSVEWKAQQTASGMYFYKFVAEKFTDTKKMLLVR